jgi:glycosyltransferase involved in cell wall biosynthesis
VKDNVLVLAALTDATGNAVTATRIARHLEERYDVTLVDANTASGRALRDVVEKKNVRAAVGVHALLAGPFLRALEVPYALVFGGTDLYEETHELQSSQMSRAVAHASTLLAFSPENRARAEWMWPSIAGRVRLLPQAVELPPAAPNFSLRARLGLGPKDVVVLLPTGIRKVKDPLHTVEALSVWHALSPNVHLVVVGAVIEPDYAEVALAEMTDRAGIHYVSPLSRPELLAAMAEADVVLNSSLSEGMCGTVLEAMALGTPVVARRNAGNESVVVHGHTGLLYDSPNELVHWVSAMARSSELRARIAKTAKVRIETHHSPAREREAYLDIAASLAGESRDDAPRSVAPSSELDHVVRTGKAIGIEPVVIEALEKLLSRCHDDEAIGRMRHELSGALNTAPPSVAIAETRRRVAASGLSPSEARTMYLLLALTQVPNARARHRALDIADDVSQATLADLALWSRQLLAQGGGHGISIDTLIWAQRYLRGELLQFGALQFDLRPFAAPMHVFRNAKGEISAASLDGRAIDMKRGVVEDERAPARDGTWELVLEPGTPMLEMWIPGNSVVGLEDVATSLRAAYATFDRIAPETVPHGVYGESWRLDPAVIDAMPDDLGVRALQDVCSLYPSALSEAKTIRRLFGPDVDRARAASLDRAAMDPMQRGIAKLLEDASVTLRARCGFVLRPDIEQLPHWSRR